MPSNQASLATAHGSFAGLGVAIFTIYNRLFRHAPILSLVPIHDEMWSRGNVYIRVTNRADRDIVIIDVESCCEDIVPRLHGDMLGHIERIMSFKSFLSLSKNEGRAGQLWFDDDFRNRLPQLDAPIDVTVRWKRSGVSRLIQGAPRKIRTSGREIDALLAGAGR